MKKSTKYERIYQTVKEIKRLKGKIENDNAELQQLHKRILLIDQLKRATYEEIDKLEKTKKRLEVQLDKG